MAGLSNVSVCASCVIDARISKLASTYSLTEAVTKLFSFNVGPGTGDGLPSSVALV